MKIRKCQLHRHENWTQNKGQEKLLQTVIRRETIKSPADLRKEKRIQYKEVKKNKIGDIEKDSESNR
jgi:hypothetical protein